MPMIDQANIACGGHAGDDASMKLTVSLAKQHGVKIGAHPSYPDKVNFGRHSQSYDSDVLFDIISQQIKQLYDICLVHDVSLDYVKPHGALYHDVMNNETVLATLAAVIKSFPTPLHLVVQAGIKTDYFNAFSLKNELPIIYEAFADRAYENGQLVARRHSHAMLQSASSIIEQYHDFCGESAFTVDTVCFHSDHPASISALQLLKANSC